MRSFLLLLGALTLAASAGAAETPKPARTCRVLFLSPPDNAPKTLFLSDGTATQEVELPSMNFSNVYALPPGNLTLRLLTSLPAKDQPLPANAPAAALAEGVRDCYLLLASDPANPVAPVRIQLIDANPDKFSKGQMLWFNLSPFPIGGQIGRQTLNLKANSRAIAEPPASGFEDYNVKIGYVPAEGKPAEMICSTVWHHDPAARGVIFVYMSPNSRAPRIKGFADSRPVELTAQP
ncbi:hypothetical protein [Luteolibacter sp. LG18]|uniref:hypothetical protein n=1 Tax=Luteolibacter sp. LG18 TaxID=2819286 RepID=UPI002B2B8756|nr:hypothetical protein llg_25650 [Luteolibacter sp. LG18]